MKVKRDWRRRRKIGVLLPLFILFANLNCLFDYRSESIQLVWIPVLMLNEKVNIFGPVWVQLGLGIAEMGPNNLWIDCFLFFYDRTCCLRIKNVGKRVGLNCGLVFCRLAAIGCHRASRWIRKFRAPPKISSAFRQVGRYSLLYVSSFLFRSPFRFEWLIQNFSLPPSTSSFLIYSSIGRWDSDVGPVPSRII